MAVPTNNPMEVRSGSMQGMVDSFPVASRTFHIAGILTTVYGLDRLPSTVQSSSVAVLWLLHPRLQTQECMASVASSAIHAWYGSSGFRKTNKGLIAVSFDQRNHGTRLVDKLGNEAWKQGNPRHAMDMFSIFAGTAQDTSLLLDYLPAYIFPQDDYSITQNIVLGISLGGHAAWHCILHDARITSAVVVIGCPDYARLMTDRAAKTKLPTYTSSTPPGKSFIGSTDFPRSLVEQVDRYDPAGLLLGEVASSSSWLEPSEDEKTRLRPIMRDVLGGKRILCLSGGQDKLVPYKCGEPFLQWLKHALRKDGGWFDDRGTVLVDVIDPEAGHEYSGMMREEAVRFLVESLEGEEQEAKADGRTSKM